MIKLIASDMDGTLLDENGKLPKDFFNVIEKLNKKGIKFVVSSGRPYKTLYENFKPISDSLHYICDNGAYIVENGNIVDVNVISNDIVNNIVETCSKINNIRLVLCGKKSAYHLKLTKKFYAEISKYYLDTTEVSDLKLIDDDIFKITICDLLGPCNNSYNILKKDYETDFSVVISGELWIDITNKSASKGQALSEIQEIEGISYDETMVFGDFYNDISMLEKAKYSFVMENANDDMKRHGNYIADANYNNGVINAIEKYVFN